ncbi:hypothetical protein [Halomonas salifodinae]|uniref:hypothetical protein n=1 Tax=Halomonas salifodinae TaxID=438745 RepID=UPI0033A7EF9A
MKCLNHSAVVALSAALVLGGETQASDERPPADFLLEMIDPSLCLVPPADMSDAEIIAMLDSDDAQMAPPVSGTWRQDGDWQAVGQGNFNTGSNGLVAGTELVLRSADDRLRFLCLGLARHVDTHMTEGQADLVGPEVATVSGDTFMVVALVGGRDGDTFVPQDELLTDSGSLSLVRSDDETMSGSLTLTGRLGDEASAETVSLELELTELWHHDGMRVVDWDHDLAVE